MKKIFIGSSSAAKKKANNMRCILKELGEDQVTCWFDPGVFQSAYSTLDNLLRLTHEYHAAVFIFDKDDELKDENQTGEPQYITRDNVILEAGLFIGALGKDAVILCHVPDAHMATDYSGITRLFYDAEDPEQMKSVLERWLNQQVREDRPPKSENNIIMKSRDDIHERYPFKNRFQIDKAGFQHIRKMRIANMTGNLIISPEFAEKAHERPGEHISQAVSSVLEKTNAVLDFMLLEPTPTNLRDASRKIPNPLTKYPEDLVYGSWKSIYEKLTSDTIYKESYQSRRFRCYGVGIGMPYAIFGIEFDAEFAKYDHVKIDLYSSNIDDESQRRSFVVWRDTDPENYSFFIRNFDSIRCDRSICRQVEPLQIKEWLDKRPQNI